MDQTRNRQDIFQVARARREQLCKQIAQHHKATDGVIVLAADFETERYAFRQESSFYYLTGISEPGVLLLQYLDGRSVLYVPGYAQSRAQWLTSQVDQALEKPHSLGVDEVKYLGNQVLGYSFSPKLEQEEYCAVIADLSALAQRNYLICTGQNLKGHRLGAQRIVLDFLMQRASVASEAMHDVSPLIDQMRRKKSIDEIRDMARAATITAKAQEAAAMAIRPGMREDEIQAVIEGIFTSLGAQRCAFPSIVATGKNSTVLHYVDRNQVMMSGDLVVIDIGAEYNYYAADITRTYPVSGCFTVRQREVYEIVLQTQAYIESLAKPGMFLRNNDLPEYSLHHLAQAFLRKSGYEQYFVHGIGHFLGLDVHDVGQTSIALAEGDVITIEPGIYIADESIGIRIEDDFVISKDGCMSLSQSLPKEVEEVEDMIHDFSA